MRWRLHHEAHHDSCGFSPGVILINLCGFFGQYRAQTLDSDFNFVALGSYCGESSGSRFLNHSAKARTLRVELRNCENCENRVIATVQTFRTFNRIQRIEIHIWRWKIRRKTRPILYLISINYENRIVY